MAFDNPFSKSSPETKDNTRMPAGKQDADKIEDLFRDEFDDSKDDKDNKDDKDKDTKTKDKDNDKDIDKDDEDLDKKDDKDKDDKDDKDDEDEVKLKEDEDEEEKLDIKEEDKTDVVAPPKKSAILAKYPKFFEEFPFFDRMMFRDKAYTEMFGSFDEAKEIAGKVERLNEFEGQLLNGDMKDVLSTIKDNSPKSFDKIVDTFLKQLMEVDKDAYNDVTSNYVKLIVHGMATEAKRKNDKDLDVAAKRLYEYLFDTEDWQDLKIRVPETKSSEQEKLDKDKEEFLNQRFTVARDSLTVKVDNILKATINEYIDPRGDMSAYEKRNAVTEALDRIHSRIGQDKVFRNQLNRLWKDSASNNFNEDTLGRIKKAYLGRANSDKLISTIIKEIRSEVLKDSKRIKKIKKEEDKEDTTSTSERRKNVNAGGPHLQESKANERKPGETVEEFLSRE